MTDDLNKKSEMIVEERDDRNKSEEIDSKQFFINNEEINDVDKGAIALERVNRLYIVLGWISAIMALFTTPFAAIAGIIFGVSLNRQKQGSGNVVIIANIVLALVNLIFNAILLIMTANMLGVY
ncbi:hypothetical protein [Acetivibrio straminisolvens]|jgi:hypothetical protein|uniref:DUF4190 domain-containing protein n=1 Tax=Acetivibrio straminisolvens JCM 21531 TaxID=1294263 RepID=W4V2K2_9FIRM|nr:hypothetical protein [Acetivibrio straminisolvens]GAE87411.1 hypothetical protein JCM21531_776 [Acetivibrio straminisolvens JCM 21531]